MEMQHALLSETSVPPHLVLHESSREGEGDSSSAGSEPLSTAPDPVSAQLINNITMLDYRSLGNTSPLILNEEDLSKSEGAPVGASNRPLPHFVTWNWNLIRSLLFWAVLSGLLACLAAVIALVASLPRTCNPQLPWFQGTLFYEIFPASFQDSNADGIGDLRGLTSRLDYIDQLGVRAVRLNSIFKCEHYPERYKNVTSLLDIDRRIGNLQDFKALVNALHKRNMTLVLDLPVYPYIEQLTLEESIATDKLGLDTPHSPSNSNRIESSSLNRQEDKVATAIKYWLSNGVEGFYLKGMEYLTEEPNFFKCISSWKRILGEDRILMVSYETFKRVPPWQHSVPTLMADVDLVDVYLEVSNGTEHVKEQVDDVMRSVSWSQAEYPWIHWNVGSVESRRLSSAVSANHTIAALLLNMMLPGTPGIFYGDEIALREISEPEEDFHESKQIHNLIPMMWEERTFTSKGVLAWLQGGGRATVGQERVIAEMAHQRHLVPPIYTNAIWRDGIGLPNAQVRVVKGILVVERWYPRRNSYVLVLNMGDSGVRGDLSSWFYGGQAVVATTPQSQGHQVMFKALSLQPAEAMLIKMEK